MTVVVQGDQTVRVTLFGGEHSRAFEQPAGAASTSTTTIPQPTARSAPSRRIVQQNRRAALHQAALTFCSNRLLKLAFRGFRMHSTFGSTSASADEASRRTSSPSPAPSQEMMQTDGDFAATVSSSSEKRTVSERDGESSRDRNHSPPSHRARRDAAGSEAARGLSSTSTMGGPSTAVYVPPLPPLPPPPIPILSPLPSDGPSPELATTMARLQHESEQKEAHEKRLRRMLRRSGLGCPFPFPTVQQSTKSRPLFGLRLRNRTLGRLLLVHPPSTARSMMVGRFSGADGRLPIRSRCRRVYG